MSRDPHQQHVTFDEVSIVEFPRCLSRLAVPSDGDWPLGLDPAHLDDVVVVSVEQYEADKQDRLRQRLRAQLDDNAQTSRRRAARKMHRRLERLSMSQAPLETRPWDYKPDEDNPLFDKLEEEDREELLLAFINASGSSWTKQQQQQADKIHQELQSLRESRLIRGCSCRPKHTKTRGARARRVEDAMDGAIELTVLPPACCTENSCVCIQAGIRCDFMACQCCGGGGSTVEPCGNPDGMCLYVEDDINQYRTATLDFLRQQA